MSDLDYIVEIIILHLFLDEDLRRKSICHPVFLRRKQWSISHLDNSNLRILDLKFIRRMKNSQHRSLRL